MGRSQMHHRLLAVKILQANRPLDVQGRILLKVMLRKQHEKLYTGYILLRTRNRGRFCEDGNELSGSIKR
jgi:hypothetical protein